MDCRLLHVSITFASSSPSFYNVFKTPKPFFNSQSTRNSSNRRLYLSVDQTLQIRCAAEGSSGVGSGWDRWVPRNFVSAEKVLRLISGATSSPICQFISSPTTFLHSLDPRIKLFALGGVCVFLNSFVASSGPQNQIVDFNYNGF